LAGIIVDGDFQDWPVDARELIDPIGDPPNVGPDFKSLRITNDAYNLYLQVEFTSPVNARYIDLKLELDADNNPATGVSSNGRGMDFIWDFDQNRGTSTLTSRYEIGRGNLIQRIAPDASATTHEIAVSLEALPAAINRKPIHITLIEENSQDRIPDSGLELSYIVQGPLTVQELPIDHRKDPRTIRIISWNVYRDAVFKSGNIEAMRRILVALQPDIILFQEIYDASTSAVLEFVQMNLQTAAGTYWEAARMNDCITVSRYPITGNWPSDGNIVSRHSTANRIGSDLLIANAHLPCCTNGESGRVSESIKILNVMENRLNDSVDAPQAVIIGGDLNSGGIAPELLLLSNDLLPLEMASPRHLYWHDQYTWGSGGSYWGSSRLDFLLFDKETIFRDKAFILDTDTLPPEALQAMELEETDTDISDHLPLVFDIRSPHLPDILQANRMEADGSATSAWWGEINALDYPYIHHETFGWIHLLETTNGLWFKPNGMNWLYTSPDTYPWTWTVNP
jgi:endonuclease/exonuclease/phosphatase family metal-dependent hydrolase